MEETATEARYPRRNRQGPGTWYVANAAIKDNEGVPATAEVALSCYAADLWRAAMDEEMASLHKNQTWRLKELPDGAKAVSCNGCGKGAAAASAGCQDCILEWSPRRVSRVGEQSTVLGSMHKT
jgi:hypothetical protein